MIQRYGGKMVAAFFILTILSPLLPSEAKAQWGMGWGGGWGGGGYGQYFSPSFYSPFFPFFPFFSPDMGGVSSINNSYNHNDDGDDDDGDDDTNNKEPEYPTVPYQFKKLAVMEDILCILYHRNGFDIMEDSPIDESGVLIFTPVDQDELELVSQIGLPGQETEDGDIPAQAEDIIIAEDTALVYQKYPALIWIIDLSNPINPKLVTSLSLEGGMITRLVSEDDLAYIAFSSMDEEESGIYLLELTSPEPEITSFLPLESKVGTIVPNGRYLYVFGKNQDQGSVFDLLSDQPEEPCASLATPGESALQLDNRLYLVTGYAEIKSRLHLFNLDNPDQPEVDESINLQGREKELLASSDYLLVWKSSVFDTEHYLEILHPDSEGAPKKVSTLHLAEPPKSLAIDEECLYILGEAGLRLLDLTDPNEPVWGEIIDLSSYLQDSDQEITDPIVEDPLAEEINQGGIYPWGFSTSPLFGGGALPWLNMGSGLKSKGYGSVTYNLMNNPMYFSSDCAYSSGCSSSGFPFSPFASSSSSWVDALFSGSDFLSPSISFYPY